jgi:hypothetical protein
MLVDRWFEPWNEMRAHPGTNAIFTFTVPNEPLENYQNFHWRDTATNFFAKFPDAAYLEIAKTYFDVPGIGPWTWPQEYFGHHHIITNSAGMVLREWGVASRGDFYAANKNGIVVDFYYNTREDMIAKFEKSGPMDMFRMKTQWFMDWRLINESVKLELVNLSNSTAQLTLTIAAAGTKTVECSAGNVQQTFPGFQANAGPPMVEWKIPVSLPPGSTAVSFRDLLWSSSPRPLFLKKISLQ